MKNIFTVASLRPFNHSGRLSPLTARDSNLRQWYTWHVISKCRIAPHIISLNYRKYRLFKACTYMIQYLSERYVTHTLFSYNFSWSETRNGFFGDMFFWSGGRGRRLEETCEGHAADVSLLSLFGDPNWNGSFGLSPCPVINSHHQDDYIFSKGFL